MMKTVLRFVALGLVLAASVSPAFAHIVDGQSSGVLHGLSHPLTGMDHMLAMLAVGIWAALVGGRAVYLVPASFVAAMAAAASFASGGVALPMIELSIIASLIVLGVLIAGNVRLPVGVGMGLVALFALAHGAAHGAEIPLGADGLAFGAGFVATTLALHVAGLATGLLLRDARLVRLLGGAVALAGCGLAFAG
jgi:urease accessory protein